MNSVHCGTLAQSAISCLLTGRGSFNISKASSQVRFASKKATGGNRNKKQAPGNNHGIKKGEGVHVYPNDILVFKQSRMWFHPGLNVTIARRFNNLVAMKEGIVRVTCEKPDLNFNHEHVKKYYSGKEGHVFFKKYFNVIPLPQHNRFKCIDQI